MPIRTTASPKSARYICSISKGIRPDFGSDFSIQHVDVSVPEDFDLTPYGNKNIGNSPGELPRQRANLPQLYHNIELAKARYGIKN